MTRDPFAPTADLTPPLPERVPCVSLWEPYASLVIAGIKTIETRTWPWPYGASWLVIHRAKHVDKAAASSLHSRLFHAQLKNGFDHREGLGALGGLVHVNGDRLLVPDDWAAACVYETGRYAWLLEKVMRFPNPLPMRGPRKIQFIPRETVLRCLGVT